MARHPWRSIYWFLPALGAVLLLTTVACGAAAPSTPAVIKKEAVKEVPKQVVPTPVPAAAPAGPVTAKVPELIIAISPPIHEIVLGWMGTTVDANIQVRHFVEPLVETERSTGQLVPGLATKWEMTSADGRKWTFKLRKGVPFHSKWGEFTAKDVGHSAALIVQKGALATDTSLFKGLLGKTEAEVLKSIETPDDYTVVFNLLRPEADMDSIASAQQGNLFMYSKAQWDAEGLAGYEKGPAGTGPWRFAGRELGRFIRYERVENHWRKTPNFGAFRLVRVPEAATRLAMMLAKEAHISEIDRDLHARAVERGMKVVNTQLPSIQLSYTIGGVYQPFMETYDPTVPALNVKVREAINRAVNRKEINDTLLGGQGSPQQVWGFHPTLPGWNPRWEQEFEKKYGYDPDRARQLIKEAGYPDGFKIKVFVTQLPGTPEMIGMAEALFNYLRAVGIQPEAEEIEWAKFRSDYYRPAKTHNTIAPIRGTYRLPDITIRFYNISGPQGFFRTLVDKAVEDKYYQAIKSVDRKERDRLFREIGDLNFDLYSQVPIAWLPGQMVLDPTVVKEFVFPGNINGPLSHIEYIVPVPK